MARRRKKRKNQGKRQKGLTAMIMGQGDEYLKSIATYVTDSIDDDGLYNACKQYQFI